MSTKDKELKTEVEVGDNKGSPLITIHDLDDDGKRKQYPVISFGKKKARAIIKHIEDIKRFADE